MRSATSRACGIGIVAMASVAMLLIFQAVADAAPLTKAQKTDFQGDLMLWVPALAPQCDPATGEDPETGIRCMSSDLGAPAGIRAGWVWSLSAIFYPAAKRELLFQKALSNGYTHFAVDVHQCDPGARWYHDIYPSCAGKGPTITAILTRLKELGFVTVCAGYSDGGTIQSGINTALCDVAMNDWDNNANAACHVGAVSAAFPNALIYYELPAGRLDAPWNGKPVDDTCVPIGGKSGAQWINELKATYPRFTGILYERSAGPDPAFTTKLTNAHAFWATAQEVLFETDTFQKFWTAPALSDAAQKAYNDGIRNSLPWIRGFMSSGTWHRRPSPAQHTLVPYDGGVVANFGDSGLWRYDVAPGSSQTFAGSWTQLHPLPADDIVRGDFDGNGVDDLAVDFGTPGLWVLRNRTTWQQLHPMSPTQMAAGDLNGDGTADLVFALTGYGTFVCYSACAAGPPSLIHGSVPALLAVANIDGLAGKDLILDFTGSGIWAFKNNATWQALHNLNADAIVGGRLDASSGPEDLAIAFPGQGLWTITNNAAWSKLHNVTPANLGAGNLDAIGWDDLVIDFGQGYGIWKYLSGPTPAFVQIHPLPAQTLAVGDLNQNGSADAVVDFGRGYGVYIAGDNGVWRQIHYASPTEP